MAVLPAVIENIELCHGVHDVVNVASVPQRSPFRYPGGKTWLVPRVRQWLHSHGEPPDCLIEPFAGGGIVSLTAIFENLVKEAILIELDHDIAAVWHTILNGQSRWLADTILGFELTRENVEMVLSAGPVEVRERAFNTILRNRISRGGILAPGAGIVKNGENGKGLASRWYPATLHKRIMEIAVFRQRLYFLEGDGVSFLASNARRPRAVFFIDPPYVVAGRRLYAHADMDHAHLFDITAKLEGDFLMTYDCTPEILGLASRHGFDVREVAMKNTHHARKTELLIGRDLSWFDRANVRG